MVKRCSNYHTRFSFGGHGQHTVASSLHQWPNVSSLLLCTQVTKPPTQSQPFKVDVTWTHLLIGWVFWCRRTISATTGLLAHKFKHSGLTGQTISARPVMSSLPKHYDHSPGTVKFPQTYPSVISTSSPVALPTSCTYNTHSVTSTLREA